MAAEGIQVTVTDLATGETESTTIWDDYVLICAGSCHRDSVQAHPGTGTHVITVKGRRERKPVGS